MRTLIKKTFTGIAKRFIAGMVVALAIVAVSALTIQTPSQHSAARSLNSIQTDKATLFYASVAPKANWFVEQVLPGTGESKAATENLKQVVAAL
jgi:site-specific recombinase